MAEGEGRVTRSQVARNRLASLVTSTTTSISYSTPSTTAARTVPSCSLGTVGATFSPMMSGIPMRSDLGPRFPHPTQRSFMTRPPVNFHDNSEDVRAQLDEIKAKLSTLDDREEELESSVSTSDIDQKPRWPIRESPALTQDTNPYGDHRQDRLGRFRTQADHRLHIPPGEYDPPHGIDPSGKPQRPRGSSRPREEVSQQQPVSEVAAILQYMRQKEEREAEERRQDREQMREMIQANATNAHQGRDRVPRPHLKVPELKPGDDIDDFLSHFESVAASYNLTEAEKILYLTGSLTEKARKACIGMPPGSSYAELQAALRKSYYLGTETYRRKFRDARKKGDETFIIYGERLTRSLESWIDMADAPLKDVILTEQLCTGINPEMITRIRELKPKTFQEAVECAESYADARRGLSIRHEEQSRSNRDRFRDSRNRDRGSNHKEAPGKSPHTPRPVPSRTQDCYYCGKSGHYKRDCQKFASDQKRPGNGPRRAVNACCPVDTSLPTFLSRVEGSMVETVRDSGATHVFVDKKYVPKGAPRGPDIQVSGIETSSQTRATVLVSVSTPYYQGRLWAIALENPICNLLIGNHIETEKGEHLLVSTDLPEGVSAAVQTRATKKAQEKELRPTLTPFPQGIALGTKKKDVQELQEQDPTLESVRRCLARPARPNAVAVYVQTDGLLYRRYTKGGNHCRQLVVPKALRKTVLEMGHDTPMAGHLGTRKTLERIRQDFYWPGINGDVRKYCRSCDPCQRTTPKGRTTRVPVGTVPLVGEPFAKVGIDLVGPIKPASSRGHRFILVVVDYATRYPEAVPLRGIDSETVAEALWQIWTRVGIPKEVLTDMGTQFVSHVMTQVNRLVGIRAQTTTPYHAQANGLVERFNATLKQMLKRLCQDHPKDWDRFVPAVLFAYREVPQESMRFSPFELLYGRTVRGPMSILRKEWTSEEDNTPEREEVRYVLDLRNRVASTCEIAKEHLKQATKRYAMYFNRKARERWHEPGSEVLLLLPVKKNKLQLAWRGPFMIRERVGDWDYRVQVGNKVRLFHANLLKTYERREATPARDQAIAAAGLAPVVIEEQDENTAPNLSPNIPVIPLVAEETWRDVHMGEQLTREQTQEARNLCKEFQDVLTDLPLRCTIGQCELVLDTESPIRVKQYPLPHSQEETIKHEIQSMLDMKVIERTSSPYSAPIVLVKKKDGCVRFCVDYRRLNKSLVFDAEPMPDVEQIFAKIGKSKYFTKLDLTKGYWQIPMHPEHRHLTAFTTPQGQFQWITMPFGLKTAGAVFSRIIRCLISSLDDPQVRNFMDDMLITSEDWPGHIQSLRGLFTRLREAQLAARPAKCHVGYHEIPFLGFVVGQGRVTPEEDKAEKIKNASPPGNKKELRAFLGLAGYYRKFVPNFATTALPLTEKTKGKQPDKVQWDDACEKAFGLLKGVLCNKPVLVLSDSDYPYTLRTDASGVGLGAVLMQDQGKGLHPVAYASKKLSDAERRYHTIEQECLAIVWGIRKFYPFLYGRHFTLQCDHHPLKYLDRIRPVSRRLMGWAMELQSHSFDFVSLKGVDNHGADYLSRAHPTE
eukprot:TRINITY_DN571_c0_g1_i10.p1 TRINITY_DN571_c0_g1~~TRINITY_DN571_c0_g1_i10.p1  ORF type:complete len:1565 (+),score=261.65 TRINITY_DN571_c0_g1_i10:102-4796(+)